MTNVYDFPTSRSKPAQEYDGVEGKARRAERLRRALANKAGFNHDDQLRVASNLQRLLEELEMELNVKRRDVARDAGLGGNADTDSTKRLDTYTLPVGATDKRRSRIAKKPHRYFDLASVIARYQGERDDVILCRIFEGCSYGSDTEILDDWEDRRWTKLSVLIHQMAESVSSEVRLSEYWRNVGGMFEVPYDVRRGAFENVWTNSAVFELKAGLANNEICSDEIPPAPSAFLARRLKAEPVPGELSLTDGTRIPVTFRYWLEIRLALGPVNGLRRIGPLLEFRTFLDAVAEDKSIFTFENPHTDGFDIVRIARSNGKEFALAGLCPYLDVEDPHHEYPEPEYRSFSEHSYFAWHEVSPALLRELFDEDDCHYQLSERLAGINCRDLPPVRFERGSPAAILHAELLNGCLERLLIDECHRLTDSFERFRFDYEARVRAAEAAAQTRWRARTIPSQPPEADSANGASVPGRSMKPEF